MRTCTRCHSENFQDVKFCNFCGSRMPRAVGASLFDDGPELVLGSAVPVQETARQGNPQEAYRWFMHGRSKLAGGSVTEAISLFQKALDADPGDPKIRKLLDRAIRLRQRAAQHAARRGEAVAMTPAPERPVMVASCHDEDMAKLPEPVDLQPAAPQVMGPGGQARSASRNLVEREGWEADSPPRQQRAAVEGLRPIRPARGGEIAQVRAEGRSSLAEAIPAVPAYRPAELLDGAPDSALGEMAVSLLLVLGVFAFAYLLVF